MTAGSKKVSDPTGWFAIRRELSQHRRLLLTFVSFLSPLAIWAAISYLPFVWHPDMKLTISADVEGMTTVYTEGDRVGRDYFRDNLVAGIQAENKAVKEARMAGTPLDGTRRANIKLLRHLAPWGIRNGYIQPDQATDDAKVFGLWRRAAQGEIGNRLKLSAENQQIVSENWKVLSAHIPGEFDTRQIPRESLLKLIPQGLPSNPVYLPAPHEVLEAGWQDLTAESLGGEKSMTQRIRQSIFIVFSGFFMAALIGIPIAILCGAFDFFSRIFEPFFDFFRYMPAPAFSTLLVAIFDVHDAPKVALVFLGTFFQLVLVISNTARGLDRSLIEASQTLGASRTDVLFRVIVPGILPQMYNDLRILLGWSWTWLVIAELIGAKSGLTEFIDTQGGRFRNFDRVFPVIIMIGLIGFFTDQLLSWLRAFLFPWTGETQGKLTRSVIGALRRFQIWLVPHTATSTEGDLK